MGICNETPEELKSSLIFLFLRKPALSSEAGYEAMDYGCKEFTESSRSDSAV